MSGHGETAKQERKQRSVGLDTHGITDTLKKHVCAKRLGDGRHTMETPRPLAVGV